jgi:ABC-type uncharacterized transport system permease subunit
VKESSKNRLILINTGNLLFSSGRPILAILLALIFSAGLILLYGADPLKAYAALLNGSIGSLAALANTGVRASPLILGGLGVAFALQAGLLNVGTEGQIYAGAIGATIIGIIPLPIPGWLHITLAFLAAMVAGGIWGLVPGYLKAYRGISEVVITLMMNYVAIYLTSYLVHEPQPLAEKGAFYPESPMVVPGAQLPILIPGTSLHIGIILGIVLCVCIYLLLRFTSFGFRIRLMGANPEAARYAGVKINRQIFMVLVIGSVMGGLAGAGEVLGLKLRLFDAFVNGVGYQGVAVALLANGNPLGVILAGLFFGALKAGASKMQITVGISTSMATIIQALCVMFVIGLGFGERVIRMKAKSKEKVVSEEVVENAN